MVYFIIWKPISRICVTGDFVDVINFATCFMKISCIKFIIVYESSISSWNFPNSNGNHCVLWGFSKCIRRNVHFMWYLSSARDINALRYGTNVIYSYIIKIAIICGQKKRASYYNWFAHQIKIHFQIRITSRGVFLEAFEAQGTAPRHQR